MDVNKDLPFLIKLLDDESPNVRKEVLHALSAIGPEITEQVMNLNPVPDENKQMLLYSLLQEYLQEHNSIVGYSNFTPGQLVRHVRYGYRGVVADLDLYCCADENWYLSNNTQPNRTQPWYHVLVDGTTQVTYAAQDSLAMTDDQHEIEHPFIPYFFEGFSGDSYIRNDRPWPRNNEED